jgi:hypothetical protein
MSVHFRILLRNIQTKLHFENTINKKNAQLSFVDLITIFELYFASQHPEKAP